MRWVVASSLKARRVVVLVAGTVILLGLSQVRSTQFDSLPEFMPPTVEVQTEALGLSAREVEQLITVPLEQDLLAGLPWLQTIRSESIPGLSSVELIFEPGTDLLRARQVVQERLTQSAGLPNVSGPPQMLQPRSSTSRVMMIRLSSKIVSPIELSVLARWTIRPRLLGVPGVANVSIWGQRERQLQVRVNPDRLRARHVPLDRIIETTGNALWASPLTFLEASTPGTGGFFDTPNQRLSIQHLQPITTASDLARVPIEGANGNRLRLGDVAEVVENHQPLIGDAVFTDKEPGLLLVIEKFPGANTLEVTRHVEAALEALKPGLTGIRIDPTVYRPATYVENGLANLGAALLVGSLLLILVLGLLFFEWRVTLVTLGTVVASLVAAWLVLYLTGTTVNTMVLAGLVMALAVVIDDSVAGVEILERRLRHRRTNGGEASPVRVALEAALETRSAIGYATLIALIAVVPLIFLQGRAAPFVPSIILSYGLATVISMVVALTVTPAARLMFLSSAPLGPRASSISGRLQRGYDRVLKRTLRKPLGVCVAAGAIVIAGLVSLLFVEQSSLPSFHDDTVLIDWNAVPGTSLPEMDRITARVGRELASLHGVRDVGAHVGRAVASDQVVGVNVGQLWVTLDPGAEYAATVSSIRRVLDGYPGIDHTVRTYSDERIDSVGLGSDRPIAVRVIGPNLRVLRTKAAAVVNALNRIDGIVDPKVALQSQEPTIDVTVDLQEADHFGIVPGDVRRSAATVLSGLGVGSLFEQQKVFDVVVWGTREARDSLTSVRHLLIHAPGGRDVPLGRVARVTMRPTDTVIRHQDLSRSIDVTAGVEGRDVGSAAADVEEALRTMRFPLEHHAELISDYAKRQAAHLRAVEVATAAAIAVLLLLQAAFGSWRLAAVAFAAIPFGLVGGIVGVLLDGAVVSIGSIVGFFTVFAITVRAVVMLIRRYQALECDDGPAFTPSLILRAARERLVPTVTTAVTAAATLLPIAVWGVTAGREIVRPMGVVIVGGLATSTFLSLFVVPNLYLVFGSHPTREPASTAAVGSRVAGRVPAS
jgi:Cu/Ag efflux pump CusA